MSEVGDEWWWAGKEQGSEKRFHSLARVKMTNNEIASIVFHISKEELLFERHVLFVQVKERTQGVFDDN